MIQQAAIASFKRKVVGKSFYAFAVQVGVLFLLAGCASEPILPPTPERADQALQPRKAAYNRPYKVKDKVYYPMDSAVGYRERGIASWYGSESGTHTAMGRRFIPEQITAAHRTLPLPCKVRVTNLHNGKAIDVLVNDRGPFAEARLIDLSQGAASKLGIKGIAEVQVEYLENRSNNF